MMMLYALMCDDVKTASDERKTVKQVTEAKYPLYHYICFIFQVHALSL